MRSLALSGIVFACGCSVLVGRLASSERSSCPGGLPPALDLAGAGAMVVVGLRESIEASRCEAAVEAGAGHPFQGLDCASLRVAALAAATAAVGMFASAVHGQSQARRCRR